MNRKSGFLWLVIVSGLMIWLGRSGQVTETQSDADKAQQKSEVAKDAVATRGFLAKPAPKQQNTQDTDTDSQSKDADQFEPESSRELRSIGEAIFRPPMKTPEGDYIPIERPMILDPTCMVHPRFQALRSNRDLIAGQGIQGAKRFPDAPLAEWTQFLQVGNRFFQISMDRVGTDPLLYVRRATSFADEYYSDPRPEPQYSDSEPTSRDQAQQGIEDLVQGLLDTGAIEMARSYLAMTYMPGENEDPSEALNQGAILEFRNGEIISFQSQGINCTGAFNLTCICDRESLQEVTPGSDTL